MADTILNSSEVNARVGELLDTSSAATLFGKVALNADTIQELAALIGPIDAADESATLNGKINAICTLLGI